MAYRHGVSRSWPAACSPPCAASFLPARDSGYCPLFHSGQGLSSPPAAASGTVLNAIALKQVPWLVGGSADLGPSTKTPHRRLRLPGQGTSYGERHIAWGIREHAMCGCCFGQRRCTAVSRPFVQPPFSFLATMPGRLFRPGRADAPAGDLRHDPRLRIGVGEDGPTRQPAEHLASFRCQASAVPERHPAGRCQMKRPLPGARRWFARHRPDHAGADAGRTCRLWTEFTGWCRRGAFRGCLHPFPGKEGHTGHHPDSHRF
ncbi:MAG: hypothetical protein M0C28_21605 [Candidatus Moduliflexus flocculans]|nr:hypothetical protein [Candidatus Moduliflexus flocculans]